MTRKSQVAKELINAIREIHLHGCVMIFNVKLWRVTRAIAFLNYTSDDRYRLCAYQLGGRDAYVVFEKEQGK